MNRWRPAGRAGSGLLRLGVLLCALAAWVASPRAERADDGYRLEILAHDTARFDAVIVCPEARVDTVVAASISYHVPRAGGWLPTETPGTPAVPFRTFFIALPPAGRFDAVWSLEEESVRRAGPVPVLVPLLDRGDSYGLPGTRDGGRGLDADAGEARWIPWQGGPAPDAFVEVGTPMWSRFQRVLPVTVRLWRVDGMASEVREARRIRLTVRFHGEDAASAERVAVPPAAHELLVPVLNPREAEGWLAAPAPVRPFAAGTAHTLGRSANPWLKIRVPRRGIYRLSRSAAEGADYPVDLVDLATVRLFAGDQLPVPTDRDVGELPEMNECAVRVEDGGAPGVWDPADAVLFLGNAADGWLQDHGMENRGFERHASHPSEPDGVYWLTWGDGFDGDPQRMKRREGLPVSPVRETGVARLHIEQNSFYDTRPRDPDASWEKYWFQQAANSSDDLEREVSFQAPGAVAGAEATVRARYWGANWNRTNTLPDHLVVARLNGVRVDSLGWDALDRLDLERTVLELREGPNRWHYLVPNVVDPADSTRFDRIYLAWLEVDYERRLTADGGVLDFFGRDGLAATYEATGFSLGSSPVAVNGTDPAAPYLIEGEAADGGATLRFRDEPAGGSPPHYTVGDLDDAAVPAGLETVDRRGEWLRDRSGAVDALVITHSDFLSAAEELAAYRASAFPDREGAVVAVVTADGIYDEFSGGQTDATAIRNFLEFAYLNWADERDPARRLRFVTFFGDPYYDPRNYLNEGGAMFVPNFQNHYDDGYRFTSYNPQFSSDDWLTIFDPATDFPAVPTGRFPVETLSQGRDMVQKMKSYEEDPVLEWWKTRICAVADDICQAPNRDNLGYAHMYQTETLIDSDLSADFHPDRIYLFEYGSLEDNLACRISTKSDATRDLIDRINDGVLVVNYTGHGSEGQLADERIFETSRVPDLVNAGKPFLFVNASCSVGKHDIPGVGLGEALVRSRTGGAVALFAAASLASSAPNAELNQLFFQQIFPGLRPAAVRPLGEAALSAKALQTTPGGRTNARRFIVLGDPALTLAAPRLEIDLSVRGRGGRAADADTLRRGDRTRIEGVVRDTSGAVVADFDGWATLQVYDSEVRRRPPTVAPADYELLGAPIFRGGVDVVSGRFSLDLVVPTALLTGDRGSAKIFAYAQDGARDAMGSRPALFIPETVGQITDTDGPRIDLELASGDSLARPGDDLSITLEDSSGINMTGLVGSRSVVLRYDDLDGRPVFVEDLASKLQFAGGASRAELVSKIPADLPTGRRYTVIVGASDNLNNRSEASLSIRLQAVGDESLVLGRVFNFPNPADGATAFFLEVNRECDVEIGVYTVRGRRIHQLEWPGQDPLDLWSRGLSWNGRDADGDVLGNGVYFYKVKVRDTTEGQEATRIEKLAILR